MKSHLTLPYGGSRIHFRHRLRHGLCVVGSCSRFRFDTSAHRHLPARVPGRATMHWVRAGIANRLKNVQSLQCSHGSDRGFVTGLAPVVSFFHSVGDCGLLCAALRPTPTHPFPRRPLGGLAVRVGRQGHIAFTADGNNGTPILPSSRAPRGVVGSAAVRHGAGASG